MPQIVEKLAKQGLTVVGGAPEHLGDFISRRSSWQRVVREAGIAPE